MLHRHAPAIARALPATAIALLAHLFASPVAHADERAHAHGRAKLDIAIAPQLISIQFESPLDNLVGFERAPRDDKERQAVDAALARLNAAETLFKIDPAAQCKLGGVTLSSVALKLGQGAPAAAEAGHADIEARFEFSCSDATKAAYVEHGLFAFKRLQRLDAQFATPKGQFKRLLRSPASRLELAR